VEIVPTTSPAILVWVFGFLCLHGRDGFADNCGGIDQSAGAFFCGLGIAIGSVSHLAVCHFQSNRQRIPLLSQLKAFLLRENVVVKVPFFLRSRFVKFPL